MCEQMCDQMKAVLSFGEKPIPTFSKQRDPSEMANMQPKSNPLYPFALEGHDLKSQHLRGSEQVSPQWPLRPSDSRLLSLPLRNCARGTVPALALWLAQSHNVF